MSAPFWGETPPATPVTPAQAEELARDVFGISGVATPLGSNQETNLRLRAGDGHSYVLKIANPAFGADVLDLQNKAMQHVAGRGTGLAVPLPVAALDGTDLVSVDLGGVAHHVRLLTFVTGEMFSDAGYLGDEVLGRFGGLAAWRPGCQGRWPRSTTRPRTGCCSTTAGTPIGWWRRWSARWPTVLAARTCSH